MKKFFLPVSLGLGGVFSLLMFFGSSPVNRGTLGFPEVLELSPSIIGKPVTAKVMLVNEMYDQLVVINLNTSCGCTKAELDTRTLSLGESATISIEVNKEASGSYVEQIMLSFIADSLPKPYVLGCKIKGQFTRPPLASPET